MKRKITLGLIALAVALVLVTSLCMVACKKNDNGESTLPALSATGIEHETKFGGVYIKITIEDFNALGFAFGDSLNVTFSNGFELLDLPYFNGFYVDMGEPLLVGYPGYPYIRAGYNNGPDMYLSASLSETDTATITLAAKGKYLDVQESLDIHYSDVQGDLTDAEFANFRAANVGNLKENVLYRSASPVDNQHNRAAVSDRLAEAAGVGFIINLSDDEEELAAHIAKEDFDSPYARSLYEQGKIVPLSMNMAFKSEGFSAKLVGGLTAASRNDGPYLVHCVEGKDRTGFVCMVLEGLAGATYQEIVDDYMITYDNYYGINAESAPTKYRIIKEKYIEVMLHCVTGDGDVDITTADYAHYVREYLLGIGMAEADVDALTEKLVQPQA
ncbi:MAG: tyrosine-protein phosphatase [Clostridia bacterium]|nr:tyrosine-protein phosphatase [Clostridia bacterium]